jgi:hypothetical protein
MPAFDLWCLSFYEYLYNSFADERQVLLLGYCPPNPSLKSLETFLLIPFTCCTIVTISSEFSYVYLFPRKLSSESACYGLKAAAIPAVQAITL